MRIPILALVLATTACGVASTFTQHFGLTPEPTSNAATCSLNPDHEGCPPHRASGMVTKPVTPDDDAVSTPMPDKEQRKQQERDRKAARCEATRFERMVDAREQIAQWVSDTKILKSQGGLAWYAQHCQRGVDQFGELMPAVCNAKLPPGASQKTVDIALDRLVDLNDHGESGIADYIYVTRANGECFASDGAAGGHLLFRRSDPEAVLQRFLESPLPSSTKGTAATTTAIPSTTAPKNP